MSDQGEDWIWYPDGADEYRPSMTQYAITYLPLCVCGKEVKPGEDYCWTCLGEAFPEDDDLWYVYGTDVIQAQTYGLQTYRYPIAIGSSVPSSHTFTSTITQTVTGVTIANQNFTISPGINVVSGDTIQFNINANSATMSK